MSYCTVRASKSLRRSPSREISYKMTTSTGSQKGFKETSGAKFVKKYTRKWPKCSGNLGLRRGSLEQIQSACSKMSTCDGFTHFASRKYAYLKRSCKDTNGRWRYGYARGAFDWWQKQ